MRPGGGQIAGVDDSEGLKSLFPAWTPETRPLSQDDDLAGFSDFNRAEFTPALPVAPEQRLFHRKIGQALLSSRPGVNIIIHIPQDDDGVFFTDFQFSRHAEVVYVAHGHVIPALVNIFFCGAVIVQ
ncbi:hypothetical protein, partial [Thermincola ferriacetica]|uniref:hypothetical protein n=1 Tax=Thermincola ferriacetica TaxID=281456 RepID=UPI0006897670